MGFFPDKFKIAKLIPTYKSEDRLLTNNFRPISVLPFFSKIFERHMYNRQNNYLDANKIFDN